jgi:hypothetical protein
VAETHFVRLPESLFREHWELSKDRSKGILRVIAEKPAILAYMFCCSFFEGNIKDTIRLQTQQEAAHDIIDVILGDMKKRSASPHAVKFITKFHFLERNDLARLTAERTCGSGPR